MNAKQFRDIRQKLGLTQTQMGQVLGLRDAGRNVRYYEAGRAVSGPVRVALRYIVRHGLDRDARKAAGLT